MQTQSPNNLPSTSPGPTQPLWRRRPILSRSLLLIGSLAILGLAIWADAPHAAVLLLGSHPVGMALFATAIVYISLGLTANAVRLILVLIYRPVASPDGEHLPTITVLVPAFNEGALVAQTLRSLAASNYPRHKMQLLAIDDGSRDDTWEHIRSAAAELGGVVHALRCRRNRGKRWALYEGFRRGRGEIFVTVDSDCIVDPDTLRNLVAPMVADRRVGGVAGNVRVLNTDAGVIPLLLSVQFVFSFDYVRSAESVVGSVFCTPGALSAYRSAAVRPVLEKWLNQEYMGRHCTIGEDRAMTNMILAQGYQVKYQSNARVLTKVPVRYKGLTRMFTRWARSNVRETLAWLKFGFGPFRHGSEWGRHLARFLFVARSLPLLLGPILLAATLLTVGMYPAVMVPKLLAGAVVGSAWMVAVCLFRGRRADAVFGILYSLFWATSLWWITPWALMTSHRGGWLTRGSPAPRTQPRRLRRLVRTFRSIELEARLAIRRALPRMNPPVG
ncbi:MAG: Undecaprenyl-phosphate 4-deoxy-4-formamido-L-arabinose transferase [Phycisphaerae bacterium]|nr:Undecaprenyl-phosphate 4-deoxy-4-formamido-L-arabinose transferase [Phycisphaerae bacterium]